MGKYSEWRDGVIKQALERELRFAGGNIHSFALKIGCARTNAHRLIVKHGIDPNEFRERPYKKIITKGGPRWVRGKR